MRTPSRFEFVRKMHDKGHQPPPSLSLTCFSLEVATLALLLQNRGKGRSHV